MKQPSRRNLLGASAAGGATLLGLPLATLAQERAAAAGGLKIIIVGGHPDDPESGCGGTMARLADLGHDVVAMYLTRGEAGIRGKAADESAAIRTKEVEQACRILKVRPIFAGQIDGATELSADRYAAFAKIFMAEKPDVVFAQWPIDTHRDHRAASLLAFDTWTRSGGKFSLFYYEVNQGSQTQMFRPTHYVDITSVEERKKAACMAHQSQDPAGFYAIHTLMMQFRGREHGCKFAEAFVHHNQSKPATLP